MSGDDKANVLVVVAIGMAIVAIVYFVNWAPPDAGSCRAMCGERNAAQFTAESSKGPASCTCLGAR